jgi:hypothetical protein
MNHPTELSSMSTPNSSAEPWPQDAVPQSWVNELFKRMARMWGNVFLDKWRDVDLEGVKIEWGKGLRKLSSTELKAGVEALLTLKFPPSLPEFYGLCKQMRLHEMPRAEALTDQTRADAHTVHASVSRMRDALAPLTRSPEPTAEWAYRLLMRGESASGKQLPFEVVRCASDAISSSAGRKALEECTDDFQRENFRTIREAIVDGYRAANKPLWETA